MKLRLTDIQCAGLKHSPGECILAGFREAATKANIVVIMGDDIGMWNMRLPSWCDGRQDAEPRQDRQRGACCSRTTMPGKLHGGSRELHHRELPIRTGMTTVGQLARRPPASRSQ